MPEDNEHRTGGFKIQSHGGAPGLRAPDRCGVNCAAAGVPQFRNLATDTERAFGGIKLPPLVGDEINIGPVGDAMDISELGAASHALEFKIWLQVLPGKNIGQNFAPDDASFAVRIFQDLAAVA